MNQDPLMKLAEQFGGKVIDLKQPLEQQRIWRPTKRLRIFINSNPPFGNSGYSTQTGMLAKRLIKAGYAVAINCFGGLSGAGNGYLIWNECPEIKLYSNINDAWGADACVLHAQDFKADVVFTIQDVPQLDPNSLRQIKNWIPIVPIDLEDVPPVLQERLNLAYRIVTFAQYGYDTLLKQGYHSTLLPYGVDTKTLTILDKKECKKALNLPEDFYIFGMVAANKDFPSRKGFEQVLTAFSKFHQKYPKSGLFLHINNFQSGAIDFGYWGKRLGIASAMFSLNPYEQAFKTDRAKMNQIINSFDCLLNPSCSEGLGATPLEAQACGVPAIVNNFTGMKGLIKDGETGFYLNEGTDRWMPIGSIARTVDTDELYDRMEETYLKKWDKTKIRQFILDNFDADKIFEDKWIPFLEKLEKELVA